MNRVGNLRFSCSNNPCVLSNLWARRECMKHWHVILEWRFLRSLRCSGLDMWLSDSQVVFLLRIFIPWVCIFRKILNIIFHWAAYESKIVIHALKKNRTLNSGTLFVCKNEVNKIQIMKMDNLLKVELI